MTEWAPEPLVLTESELKTIQESLYDSRNGYDEYPIYQKIDQHLFELRLARNPEVIESLKRAVSDLKGDKLIEREI